MVFNFIIDRATLPKNIKSPAVVVVGAANDDQADSLSFHKFHHTLSVIIKDNVERIGIVNDGIANVDRATLPHAYNLSTILRKSRG